MVLRPIAPSYNLLKKGKVSADLADFDEFEFEDNEFEVAEEGDDSDLDADAYEDDSGMESLDDHDHDDDLADSERVIDFGKLRQDAEDHQFAAALEDLAAGPSLADSAKLKGKFPATTAANASAEIPDNDDRDSSLYGVFFKNQKEYDYSQHLKPIGEDPTAVFVEAKTIVESRKADAKQKGIRFLDTSASTAMSEHPKRKVNFNIPSEVLPSQYEEDIGMLARADVTAHNVEPSMREAIYALDDEAYIEEDIDDFFEALNAEEVPPEIKSKLDPEDFIPGKPDEDEKFDAQDENEDWYAEYQRFKNKPTDSEDEYDDEQADELGSLVERRTALTNLSMTSSAMVRTALLSNLDDQFDQALKKYDDDDDEFSEVGDFGDRNNQENEWESATDNGLRANSQQQPTISTSRMNEIFDSFLESTEVVGRKGLVLNKVPALNKIDSIRRELGEVTRLTEAMTLSVDDTVEGGDILDAELEREIQELRPQLNENRWDVETVLTTYSNIYNHPQMIKDVMASTKKIRLGKKGPRVVDTQNTVAEKNEDLVDGSNDVEGSEIEEDFVE
ncbi:hypothetical protein HDU82_003302, partial [Entophlyctis luteolus]